MLHTQYVFVYKDTCILIINFAPQKLNPSFATYPNRDTTDPNRHESQRSTSFISKPVKFKLTLKMFLQERGV